MAHVILHYEIEAEQENSYFLGNSHRISGFYSEGNAVTLNAGFQRHDVLSVMKNVHCIPKVLWK
jgi:hypothetical protein